MGAWPRNLKATDQSRGGPYREVLGAQFERLVEAILAPTAKSWGVVRGAQVRCADSSIACSSLCVIR
jgi:hypothetical protein